MQRIGIVLNAESGKISIHTTGADGAPVWQARDIPVLAAAGQPVAGKLTATADGFRFETTTPRELILTAVVRDDRLLLTLTESATPGATVPERMRRAAEAPPVQVLPGLFALDPAEERSGFVLPIAEGLWVPVSTVVVQATVKLYFVMGLAMGFWAVCRPGRGTVVGLSDHPYLQFAMEGGAWGQRWTPEWLRDPDTVPLQLEIAFIAGEQPLDAAKEFRRHEFAHKQLVPLARRPAMQNLAGGANIKFFNLTNRVARPPDRPGGEKRLYRFADVARVCRELRTLGLDRVTAIFWGWGKEGYDRLHPDFLPANEWAGGDAGLRAASDEIRALGFSVGGHDNYQDIYEAAPSFGKGESVCVTPAGELQAGGFWTGGQCYIQCSAEALRFARRNLPQMRERYGWNALFIDTTTAAHLYECYSEHHPRTRADDRRDKQALLDLGRELFGLCGSEAGFSWSAAHMDYWEGILLIPLDLSGGFKWWGQEMRARPLPIFGAVYRDVALAYQHQSCGLGPNTPLLFLAALRSGQPPYYFLNEEVTPALTTYLRQSYEVLAHLHRLTLNETVAEHHWLTADGLVERTVLTDGTEIVTNSSTQPYVTTDYALPAYGFFVRGPQFLAFWADRVGTMTFQPARWAVVRPGVVFSEPATDAAGEAQLRALLR